MVRSRFTHALSQMVMETASEAPDENVEYQQQRTPCHKRQRGQAGTWKRCFGKKERAEAEARAREVARVTTLLSLSFSACPSR